MVNVYRVGALFGHQLKKANIVKTAAERMFIITNIKRNEFLKLLQGGLQHG